MHTFILNRSCRNCSRKISNNNKVTWFFISLKFNCFLIHVFLCFSSYQIRVGDVSFDFTKVNENRVQVFTNMQVKMISCVSKSLKQSVVGLNTICMLTCSVGMKIFLFNVEAVRQSCYFLPGSPIHFFAFLLTVCLHL